MVLVLALAACGGDDDGGDRAADATATPTSTPIASTSTTFESTIPVELLGRWQTVLPTPTA